MPSFTRAELEEAFAHYVAVNEDASRRKDWQAWADKFTSDVHYVECAFGEFHGRDAVRQWITRVMAPYPQMDFPMDWQVFDEERGWVVFQCQNRLHHPTDPEGAPFQFATWSKIHYAGDGLWSYEEDMYHPGAAGQAISAWRAAGGRLLERQLHAE